VGICPGATFGVAKRWPPERFAEAARNLRKRWGAAVFLMGSREERRISKDLSGMIGEGVLDFTGKTDIERLAALLQICTVVLANDSGPMHLASVLGTPVVALFASTDPTATAPLGPHRIVRSRVECAPCLKRRCPEGTYRCQEAIRVEEVLSAAEALLQGGSRYRREP
jgi:heptosyltransferase-2